MCESLLGIYYFVIYLIYYFISLTYMRASGTAHTPWMPLDFLSRMGVALYKGSYRPWAPVPDRGCKVQRHPGTSQPRALGLYRTG